MTRAPRRGCVSAGSPWLASCLGISCAAQPAPVITDSPSPDLLAGGQRALSVGEQSVGLSLLIEGSTQPPATDSSVISDALLVEGARRLGRLEQAQLRAVRDEALALALRAQLRADSVHGAPAPAPPSAPQLELELWRILVPDPLLAHELLSQLQPFDPRKWAELARQHSKDRATHLRAGNLGFVDARGQTHRPQVRVAAALHRAATAVADGEVVPVPVAEGRDWAVVWRRGSRLKATEPVLAPAWRRFDESLNALLSALRKRHLQEHRLEPLRHWKPAAPTLTPAPSPANPTELRLWPPEPSDRGWR